MSDQDLKIGRVSTSHGVLYFMSDRDPRDSARPVVFVLHGALRHSENTQGWLPVLADHFDVVLVDLPGHGRTPSDGQPTIRAFTARVREFIAGHFAGRDMVVLGESVGGLLALWLADGRTPEIKGVVVSDPPLTTSKQWAVFNNYLKPKAGPLTDFLKAFYASTFGYVGTGITGERIYYPLVAGAKVPTLILTGDLPLFPVRNMPMQIPCLIDEVDKTIIRWIGNPLVSLETIPDSGHLCLDCTREEARAAVNAFCAAQLLVQQNGRVPAHAAT